MLPGGRASGPPLLFTPLYGRYSVEKVFDAQEYQDDAVAWDALRASAQDPNPQDVTSNTQWSAVYDDTALTLRVCLRRNWADVIEFKL